MKNNIGKTINWNKKFKNKECQLCKKKTKERISFMVGGCVTYVHKSCLNVVENYRKLLLKWEKQIQKIKSMDAPCIVCQKREEVDSGMCGVCLKDAIKNSKKSISPPKPKGMGIQNGRTI